MTDKQLSDFMKGYIDAILFTELTDDGKPWDIFYTRNHIAHGSWDALIGDCVKFLSRAGHMIEQEPRLHSQWTNAEMAGHDFWLTRQGHGAGFWDGDWDVYGDKLTEMAKSFGEVYPCIGDDNLIYY